VRRSLFVLATILCAFFGVYAGSAFAALPYTPDFSWTAPTTNTDGSAIPATGTLALKEYRLYCAIPPLVISKANAPVRVIAAPSTVAPNTVMVSTGNWACAMTAVNNAAVGANESALTNPLAFTTVSPVPQPPSVLTVQ
jgi:hypothetical protein